MFIMLNFILMGIAFMIGTLVYVKNKNSLQEIKPIDKSNTKKVKKTLKNLWGIDGIANQVVTINRNQHSIIVELESIEYSLLHEEERNSVDAGLTSIARMIKFPIQFLEIKRKIDMEEAIENIQINTINSNNAIKEYAKHFIKHLDSISHNEDLFERKNYMIISSFNNRKTAEMELKEFYQQLKYHLMDIKISTRLLADTEIIELLYEQLHKGSSNKVHDIQEKGGLELYVKAENKEKNKTL